MNDASQFCRQTHFISTLRSTLKIFSGNQDYRRHLIRYENTEKFVNTFLKTDEETNKKYYLEQDLLVECIDKCNVQIYLTNKDICITHNNEDFEKNVNDPSSKQTVLLIQNIDKFDLIQKIHKHEENNVNYKDFTCNQNMSHNLFLYSHNENCTRKTIIISAKPGMGKSRLLKCVHNNLFDTTKEHFANIYVDLPRCAGNLSKLKSEVDNSILNNLSKGEINKNLTSFLITILKLDSEAQKSFLTQVIDKGWFVLVVDGYDEVCPQYLEEVDYFLQLAQHSPTARPCVILKARG